MCVLEQAARDEAVHRATALQLELTQAQVAAGLQPHAVPAFSPSRYALRQAEVQRLKSLHAAEQSEFKRVSSELDTLQAANAM